MRPDVARVLVVVAAALAVVWLLLQGAAVDVPTFPSEPPAAPTAEFRYRPLPHTTPWGPRLTVEPRP